jgi:hypothetical protein
LQQPAATALFRAVKRVACGALHDLQQVWSRFHGRSCTCSRRPRDDRRYFR